MSNALIDLDFKAWLELLHVFGPLFLYRIWEVGGYWPKSGMEENDPSSQDMTQQCFHNLTKHQIIFCHPWLKCTPYESFFSGLTPQSVSPFTKLLS